MSLQPILVLVFDASVIIPLSLPPGRSKASRLLTRLLAAGHVVRVTPQILAEVGEKMRTKKRLRRWLHITDEEIEEFLKDLPTALGAKPLKGTVSTPGAVKADPKDDHVIAAAVEAKASYIVTEDRHLLDLKEYAGIKIMTVVAFMTELDLLGVPRIR